MKRKSGFTLLEILIVVVIAVSVAAFALPAYKKMQDRTNYDAAQGVLIEVANGLMMLQEEVKTASENGASIVRYPVAAMVVKNSWQSDSRIEPDMPLSARYGYLVLFARRYIGPLPLNSSNTYKNYQFVLCPDGTASSSYCCQGDSRVVACMYDPNYSSRATKGEYYGAAYYDDGTVLRIAKRS